MSGGPNIALVVFDTLRKDTFDEHFGWLKKQASYFENAWSTSHWTVPAHASLFTGHYASELGTHAKNRNFDPETTPLATALSENDYRCCGVTANRTVAPLFGFDAGYESYDVIGVGRDLSKYVDDSRSPVGKYLGFFSNVIQSDMKTVPTLKRALTEKFPSVYRQDDGASEALKVISEMDFADKNEFLFLNLMEAHSPFRPPRKYKTGPDSELNGFKATSQGYPSHSANQIKRAYDDSVRYLSDAFEDIFTKLTDDFDYIIALSDHGEAFGEGGIWGHTSALSPSITQIPLTVWSANSEITQTDVPVSLLDVFQTIVDISGSESGQDTRGKSLLKTLSEDRYCIVETHGVTAQEQELWHGLSDPKINLEIMDQERFAVATRSGYGFETIDGTISGLDQEIVWKAVDAHKSEREVADIGEEEELTKDVKQHLEFLGYA